MVGVPPIFRYDVSHLGFTATGKGSKLTAAEVDENFAKEWVEILALNEAISNGFAIMDITVDDEIAPTTMIITLESYETFNIPLPVATFVPRGAWTNNTLYSRLNIVDVSGYGQYWVRVAHTTPASPAVFDPDAVDGEGNELYALFSTFAANLRWRGDYEAGQNYAVYDVFFHDTYGLFLTLIDHETATDFDPYAEDTGEPIYKWIAPRNFSKTKTVTDVSYIVDPLDVGRYIRFTNVDGCVITFPDYVEFPPDAQIEFRQASVGPLTFEADAGFTLNPQRQGYDTSTFYEGAVVCVKFIAVDEADLIGPYGDLLVT